MLNEADTCRILITHKLKAALWDDDQIREQISFTDGRIVAIGNHAKRKTQRRADYILRYSHDAALTDSVVKAKGLIDYAQKHGQDFDHIQLIIKDPTGRLQRLDLKDEQVQARVMALKDTEPGELTKIIEEVG